MATVPNTGNRAQPIDGSFVTPNRKLASLTAPLYAGEIVLNTTNNLCYVATDLTATGWVQFTYGMAINKLA
jgi:hypothetical protein